MRLRRRHDLLELERVEPHAPSPRASSRFATTLLLASAWLAVASLILSVPVAASARSADAPLDLASFPRSTLTVHAAGGTGHVFRVWIADTPERQLQGLMYVRDLPADEGMLFVHREPRPMAMWMKNTFVSLDMLFIDARGRIMRIFERTVPHSLETLGHAAPVKAVLELRGGECARRGIRVGDRVEHASFRPLRGVRVPDATKGAAASTPAR